MSFPHLDLRPEFPRRSPPLLPSVLMNSGRKLQWLWHMQRCEFRTNYLSQKLIFMTNAFQMAILLQFNESDSISLEDLHTATSIPEQTLKNHLLPMVKMKVLLQDGDTYDLNLSMSTHFFSAITNDQTSSRKR